MHTKTLLTRDNWVERSWRRSKPSWLARTLRARLASALNESMLTRGPVAELRHADHPRDFARIAGAFAAGKHKVLLCGYNQLLTTHPSTSAWLRCVQSASPTRQTIETQSIAKTSSGRVRTDNDEIERRATPLAGHGWRE
jgi:hypothetical protein